MEPVLYMNTGVLADREEVFTEFDKKCILLKSLTLSLSVKLANVLSPDF